MEGCWSTPNSRAAAGVRGRPAQLVLSPDAPVIFSLQCHCAQAEGTDAVTDLPVSRLKAGADPAALAGSEHVVLPLMLKMCQDSSQGAWVLQGMTEEGHVLGKKVVALCAAAAFPFTVWLRSCSPLPHSAVDVL